MSASMRLSIRFGSFCHFDSTASWTCNAMQWIKIQKRRERTEGKYIYIYRIEREAKVKGEWKKTKIKAPDECRPILPATFFIVRSLIDWSATGCVVISKSKKFCFSVVKTPFSTRPYIAANKHTHNGKRFKTTTTIPFIPWRDVRVRCGADIAASMGSTFRHWVTQSNLGRPQGDP